MRAYRSVSGSGGWATAPTLRLALAPPDRAGALVAGLLLPWSFSMALDLPRDPDLAAAGDRRFPLRSLGMLCRERSRARGAPSTSG